MALHHSQPHYCYHPYYYVSLHKPSLEYVAQARLIVDPKRQRVFTTMVAVRELAWLGDFLSTDQFD